MQVAMILRNATFIEENVPTLAGDSTFLRFVLLCCGSRWSCLHQLGFDMLSNIAHELVLEDLLVDHLMRIICRGLESPDRTVILGCVETLNKLGQKEENEEIMLRCIEQKVGHSAHVWLPKILARICPLPPPTLLTVLFLNFLQVYSRICSFLSLQDIMLLIHTLECLYSLSSLGEKACNSIVHVSGAIDTLISLVTVEVSREIRPNSAPNFDYGLWVAYSKFWKCRHPRTNSKKKKWIYRKFWFYVGEILKKFLKSLL